MSLRKVWETEILIRLTENGFVETVRRFGRKTSFEYETESALAEEAAGDECPLVPVLLKRNEYRRRTDAS